MDNIKQANPLAEYLELESEISTALQRVLNGGRYVRGPEVEAFENEFATYIGVNHAVGMASGTDAIHLALRALGIGPGDEVITVSHTAVATVAAIEQCGATPVLVDIDPRTYTMDAAQLPQAISRRSRAIVPVHIYGHPADLDPILAIAQKNGLAVLEDCAQSHGASYGGRRVGSFGAIAAFSFYPTKNLGAIGDGGMILTSDAALAAKVRSLQEYGWRQRYVSEIPGFNSRLDELQAAILRVKLSHLDRHNHQRRELAQEYTARLAECVTTPVDRAGSVHVYHLYVIRTPRRDGLQKFLADRGIGTAIHYPVPVHLQPAYLRPGFGAGSLPVTEEVAGEILSLPLYPQMTVEQVERVACAIKEYLDVGG